MVAPSLRIVRFLTLAISAAPSLAFGLSDRDEAAMQALYSRRNACRVFLEAAELFTRMLEDSKLRALKIGHAESAWEKASVLFGMPSAGADLDFAIENDLRMKVVGEPRADSYLDIGVFAKGAVVKTVRIPWKPAEYRTSLIIEGIPIGREVKLGSDFLAGLPVEFRERVAVQREALEAMNARVALAFLRETPPFSMAFAESSGFAIQQKFQFFLRHEKILPVLRGEEPVRYLYQLHSYIGPPGELFGVLFPGMARSSRTIDQVDVTWIQSGENLRKSELIHLAVSELFLKLERNLLAWEGKRASAANFANSISISGPEIEMNFHHLDLNAMHALYDERHLGAENQWLTAHRALQDYIAAIYQGELHLSATQTDVLNAFTSENERRMEYFFFTKERAIEGVAAKSSSAFPNASYPFPAKSIERTGKFDRFSVRGMFGVLHVNSSTEKFSMEAYAGVRPTYRQGEHVVELTRFGMDEDIREYGPRTVYQVSAYLLNVQKVDRVTLITRESYAKQLVERFGFRKTQEKAWVGKEPDWVLEMTPEDFARSSLATLLTHR